MGMYSEFLKFANHSKKTAGLIDDAKVMWKYRPAWLGGKDQYGDVSKPGFSPDRIKEVFDTWIRNDSRGAGFNSGAQRALWHNAHMAATGRWDPNANIYRAQATDFNNAATDQSAVKQGLVSGMHGYKNRFKDFESRVLQAPLLVDKDKLTPIWDPVTFSMPIQGRMSDSPFTYVTDYVTQHGRPTFAAGKPYTLPGNYVNYERAAYGDYKANRNQWFRAINSEQQGKGRTDPLDTKFDIEFGIRNGEMSDKRRAHSAVAPSGTVKIPSGSFEDPDLEDALLESDAAGYRKYNAGVLEEEILHKGLPFGPLRTIERGDIDKNHSIGNKHENSLLRIAGREPGQSSSWAYPLGNGGYAANSPWEYHVGTEAARMEFVRAFNRDPSPAELVAFSQQLYDAGTGAAATKLPSSSLAGQTYYRRRLNDKTGYRRDTEIPWFLSIRPYAADMYDRKVNQDSRFRSEGATSSVPLYKSLLTNSWNEF